MREHTSSYRVNLFNVDAFGELGAVALLEFLQQTASDASAAVGYDVDWYEQQGTIWLIRRTQVRRLAPAVYRDVVDVRTWVTDIRRVRSQRVYEMRRQRDGLLLASGTSDWVYVDLKRAAPITPPREMQLALMPDGIVTQERPSRSLNRPPPHAFRGTRRVTFAELDSVAHVNNAQYAGYLVQDAYDALAAHGWSLNPLVPHLRPSWQQLDLEYYEPAVYADQLEAIVWVTDVDDAGFTCEHMLARGGRRVLRAHTRWGWLDGTPPPEMLAAVQALAGRVAC